MLTLGYINAVTLHHSHASSISVSVLLLSGKVLICRNTTNEKGCNFFLNVKIL